MLFVAFEHLSDDARLLLLYEREREFLMCLTGSLGRKMLDIMVKMVKCDFAFPDHPCME